MPFSIWISWFELSWFWMGLTLPCFSCAFARKFLFHGTSSLLWPDPLASKPLPFGCSPLASHCKAYWTISKFIITITLLSTSFLLASAMISLSFCFIVWFLNYVTSFEFCLSSNYLSSPFSKFKNAFAYCAACPCIKNILLCSVSLIYFANFSFSFYFCFSFYSSFFLYSSIDFAFTSSTLRFS